VVVASHARDALALAAALALSLTCASARAQSQQTPQPRGSLSADSITASAIASRLPRDRPDTIRSFPIRRLADGVYAVVGDTGRGSEGRSNAGFIVTRDGVVVIDALASPAQGATLLRTIRTVTRLPIRWLILTHHHPDHHFGAIVLKRAGARVIAHPDRQTLASADGDDVMVSNWTGVLGLREMQGFEFADTPDVSVTGDTTIVVGGRTLVISHPGAAHTPGDLTIWLPAERVLFAGDLLIEDGVTMVVDGSSAILLAALDRLEALRPAAIVPGHGRIPDDPQSLIARTRCYMLGLRRTMRAAVEEGTSMSRALAKLPPADMNRPVSRRSRERRNAVRVYAEVEKEVMQSDTSAAKADDARARAECKQ
jgi:glyoxylase-like metal-dependent hydrolase (beta-lactamase superfamily II)